MKFLRPHGAHGVEDGEEGDAHVGEDRRPEVHPAECAEEEDGRLDADGEGDVLPCDTDGAACEGEENFINIYLRKPPPARYYR